MTAVWKNSTLKICGLTITILAFLFQLSAVVTPGWIVLHIELEVQNTPNEFGYETLPSAQNEPEHIRTKVLCGLWYMVACVDTVGLTEDGADGRSICMTYFDPVAFSNQLPGDDSNKGALPPSAISGLASIVEFEVESSLSLLCCLGGLILLCLSFKPYPSSRTYAGIAAICFLVSGLTFWIPIGKFLLINETLDSEMHLEPNPASDSEMPEVSFSMKSAYSLVLAAIGACLALTQSLIIMCYLWKNPRVTGGQVLGNGAPLDSLTHSTMTSPYGQAGYTVTVTSGPVPAAACIAPFPSTMAVGPMDSVTQPLASEFGPKHSLLKNPEVNC
ncbi:hypothetical protein ScPMuIL_005088 [Solemya velum]